MMVLLTKLLLAHLIADFILQPDDWVKDKQLRKWRSPRLYLHVAIHAALAFILVWDVSFWLPATFILVSHYAIDLLKVSFERTQNRISWFIADQLLHLMVIASIWYAWEQPVFGFPFDIAGTLIVLTAAVFLTNPTSVIIKTIISQWTPETLYTVNTSLPDAGKIIGFLERLLVLLFILTAHWEAVGFLLAAKSVFRFGNLKESHDRKLTEYVLIGTFLSFGIAILTALCTSVLMSMAPHL